MRFISVISASQTANAGTLVLVIRVDPEDGSGEQDWGFCYDPDDREGLTPEVENFFFDHPDFPVAPYVPPTPTGDQIGAERERRIAMPLLVAVPGLDPFEINMDGASQRNIQGLASQGMLLMMTSDPTTVQFRDYANEFHALGGAQLVAMGQQAAARIQACYQAQWALMDLDPVPMDYTSDAYWPEPVPPGYVP